jgi:hypothetical protein
MVDKMKTVNLTKGLMAIIDDDFDAYKRALLSIGQDLIDRNG